MTPRALQDAVKGVVEKALEGLQLGGGGSFRVHTQVPPRRQVDGDLSIFPFAVVSLGDGEDGDGVSTQDVVVTLCVYDPAEDEQGHRDILNTIQRLREQFNKHPVLDGRFEVQKPIKWTVVDENTSPYFYGGVLLTVGIPTISRVNNNI